MIGWLLAFLLLFGLAAPARADEDRCTALTTNCVCSEPFNMTAFTNTSGSFWNPTDTNSKPCSQSIANAPVDRNATPAIITDATALAALPSAHTNSRFIGGNPGHSGTFDIGADKTSGDLGATFLARMAMRGYIYHSPDYNFRDEPNDQTGCHSKFLQQRGSSGGWHWENAWGYIHMYDFLAPGVWGPSPPFNFGGVNGAGIDCCFSAPMPPGTHVFTESDWKGRWWRVEDVVTNRAGPGVRHVLYMQDITQGVTQINGGVEFIASDWIETFNGGSYGANSWPGSGIGITSNQRQIPMRFNLYRETGQPNRPGVCSGFRGVAYMMVAGWDTDAGQRIGPACEIEGGCGGGGDVTPPVITQTIPTGELGFGITSDYCGVTTDELATCKWATSDMAYAAMPNTFASTAPATTHATAVSPLISGANTFKVRCIDLAGNASTASTNCTLNVAAAAGIREEHGGAQRVTSSVAANRDSTSVTLPLPNKAGSLIVCGGAAWTSTGAPATVAVTDTFSTPYTFCSGFASGDTDNRLWQVYGVTPSAGANTITANPTGSASDFSFQCMALTGVDTTIPADSACSVQSFTPTTTPSVNYTTTNANSWIVATMHPGGSPTSATKGASYTEVGQNITSNNNSSNAMEFRSTTTAGVYAVNWASLSPVGSDNGAILAQSFKPAGAGGGDIIPPTNLIITSPTASTYYTTTQPIAASGTATDNVGVDHVIFSCNTGSSGTCTGTTAWSCPSIGLAAGSNTCTITAFDAAGNFTDVILTAIFDTVAPSIAVSVPSFSPFPTRVSTISPFGTSADTGGAGVSGVSCSSDRTGNCTGSITGSTSWFSSSIDLLPGTNQITFTAFDNAGNSMATVVTVVYTPQQPAGGGAIVW